MNIHFIISLLLVVVFAANLHIAVWGYALMCKWGDKKYSKWNGHNQRNGYDMSFLYGVLGCLLGCLMCLVLLVSELAQA